MKVVRFFLFVTTLIFSCCPVSVDASPFKAGAKYRIVSNDRGSGAIALGAYHDNVAQIYYVEDEANLSDDCWWYFDDKGNNQFVVRNAKTGECLMYTSKIESGVYSNLTLSTADEATAWKLTASPTFSFVFSTQADVTRYMRLGPAKEGAQANMVKVDKYDGIYTYFNIYDEDGNKLSPNDLDDIPDTGLNADPEPTVTTDLDAYATDIQLNGRRIAWMSNLGMWLGVVPADSEMDVVMTATTTDANYEVALYDGNTRVEKASQISPQREYSLIVSRGADSVATSKITFTAMPILDMRHGGKFSGKMLSYVWGHFYLMSRNNEPTVYLSAKYKTRGATAANWSKHSLNLKLRNYETGAEEDSTLLGMRQASSWILDAMAIDRIKMRNRVCFDLWNQFSKLPYDTEFGGRNGTVGTFIEVIMNGEYQGIYCMTDRINRKLLNLKKPKLDDADNLKAIRGVLYKSSSWDYTGLTESQREDWEKLMGGDTRNTTLFCNWELVEPEDYPCEEAWQPMADLYANAADNSYIKKHFWMENVADYHLFALNFCLADNGNKNEFLSIRNIQKLSETAPEEYDRSRFVFTPWDCDASLGGRYDGEVFYNGTYNDSDIRDYRINQNRPFKNLLNDSTYLALIKQRWEEARVGAFSAENVTSVMNGYANMFISSGAYAREQTAWPRYNQLVDDLQVEVNYISEWYAAHILKMDDYFGVAHIADGIAPITSSAPADASAIYDLSGRRVNSEALPAGIYLKGGKKILVK